MSLSCESVSLIRWFGKNYAYINRAISNDMTCRGEARNFKLGGKDKIILKKIKRN